MATVRLELTYSEIDFALYDTIVVWRSTEGSSGPYTKITAVSARGARLPAVEGELPSTAPAGPLVNANGLSAVFVTRDGTFTVTATGSDPLTTSDVADQIQSGSAGRLYASVLEDGLVVQTTRTGQAAYLSVSGELATRCGLPADTVYGLDGNVALISGSLRYSFTDQQGSSSYFYKTNFRSSRSGAESELSGPFSPSDVQDPTGTAVGFIRLRDVSGRPLMGKQIRIFSLGSTQPGVTHTGADVVSTTDRTGYTAFTLLRGATVQVVVDGTSLVRDVTVPTDENVEVFDLMDAAYSADDAFTVQRPNIPAAPRRAI